MTDCPPGRGTAVSPAIAPEPAAFAPPARSGSGAAAGTPAADMPPAAVPFADESPDEQPAASKQVPTVSRSVQAAARRGRDRGAVKRDTGAVMPMGRQRWHAGSHGYVTTWQLCWPGGATPRNPPVACGPVPSSPGRGRIGPGERPPGTPRWPAARFLRHRAGAALADAV